MTLPEKFCIAPFKNLVIGTNGELLPCCDYMTKGPDIKDFDLWKTGALKDLQHNMILGKIDQGCHSCIKKEDNQFYQSHRQFLNKKYKNIIEDTINDFTNGIMPQLDRVEFRVANYCNLKCRMCGEYASSSISAEYQKNKEKYNSISLHMDINKTYRWWEEPGVLEKIKNLLSTVTDVSLAGGEPLIVEEFIDMLTQVSNSFNLNISTSLYVKNKHILDKIKSLYKIKLYVSLEGIEEHNDYVRSGSEWKVIEENINYVKSSNVIVHITHVLQHTSIFAIPNLIEFAEHNNVGISFHEVNNNSYPAPGVLTIRSAHPMDVELFKQWLSNYNGEYKHLLSVWANSYQYNVDLNYQFHQYMNMLDSIRNTNFKKVFNPHYDNEVY
jgi:MoaA/NifB/PqqE/SkfB family radical SAM enzyme